MKTSFSVELYASTALSSHQQQQLPAFVISVYFAIAKHILNNAQRWQWRPKLFCVPFEWGMFLLLRNKEIKPKPVSAFRQLSSNRKISQIWAAQLCNEVAKFTNLKWFRQMVRLIDYQQLGRFTKDKSNFLLSPQSTFIQHNKTQLSRELRVHTIDEQVEMKKSRLNAWSTLSELLKVQFCRTFQFAVREFFAGCLLCCESSEMKSMNGLERKIDKHIKENADQMKLFKHELQSLKSLPKPKGSRPSTDTAKAKEALRKHQTIRPVRTDDKRLDCWLDPKMSKRAVNVLFRCRRHFVLANAHFNHFSLPSKCAASSGWRRNEQADMPRQRSTQHVLDRIIHLANIDDRLSENQLQRQSDGGEVQSVEVDSISRHRVKSKAQGFPAGWWIPTRQRHVQQISLILVSPPDDEDISKVLREINYAIKQAKLERHPKEVRSELITQTWGM